MNIDGYILKDHYNLVIPAVKAVLAGKEYYEEKVQQTLDVTLNDEKFLTPKEEEIVLLLAEGNNNQEIAEKLFISFNTVRTHRKNIRNKLDISSTGELIRYYFQNYVT